MYTYASRIHCTFTCSLLVYTHTHSKKAHTQHTHTLAGRQTHESVKLVCVLHAQYTLFTLDDQPVSSMMVWRPHVGITQDRSVAPPPASPAQVPPQLTVGGNGVPLPAHQETSTQAHCRHTQENTNFTFNTNTAAMWHLDHINSDEYNGTTYIKLYC